MNTHVTTLKNITEKLRKDSSELESRKKAARMRIMSLRLLGRQNKYDTETTASKPANCSGSADKDLVSELEHANNRVYNLSLYLDYIRQNWHPAWEDLMTRFEGMPGWSRDTARYEGKSKSAYPTEPDQSKSEYSIQPFTISFTGKLENEDELRKMIKEDTDKFLYS